MNVRILFTVLFLALLSQSADAQGFLNILTKGSFGRDLTHTPDGGYVVVGSIRTDSMSAANIPRNAWIAYVNPEGGMVWEKHVDLDGVGIGSVCSATDGTVVWVSNSVSGQDDFYVRVVKMNSVGQILWQKDLVHVGFGGFSDIVASDDGGVYVMGNDIVPGMDFDFRLVRFDADGTVVWDKLMGTPLVNETGTQMVVLESGELLVAGDNFSLDTMGDSKVTLMKTDANGDILWQRWFDHQEDLRCEGIAVQEDGQTGILIEAENTNYRLLTTDSDGQQTALYTIGTNQPNYPTHQALALCSDGDDGFVVTGILQGGSPTWAPTVNFMQKINILGEVQWIKTYPVENGLPYNIVRDSDGGFATAGYMVKTNIPGTGFHAFLLKTNANGDLYTNTINGSVYFDDNDNCTRQVGEPPLNGFIVRAQKNGGETIYATCQSDGSWSMPIGVGNFSFALLPRYGASNVWQNCNMVPLAISDTFQTIDLPETGARSLVNCPYLDVDLGSFIFRPCLETYLSVNYCNNGNQTATDAYVEITLDPLFSYVSSQVPLVSQNGDVYTFDLGGVAPGDCNSFKINVLLSCDAQLGQTLCADAHIFPDTSCLPPDPLWDGSHLVVTGVCDGSSAAFTVSNVGTGNMSEAANFVIIEDQIIYMQGPIQLGAGQDSVFSIPAGSGNTYYMRVDQTPNHPGNSNPSVGVEACNGTSNIPGLLLQLAQNESDLFLATHCDIVRAAYDPNDKQGFPLGWQNANYIERGQELDYMIRFQNTGNDTAFLVVIRDTIDKATLDITSIRPGASSHTYTWEVTGPGVLKFTFENILLPDSTTNLAASQGFVQFRIAQQPNLAAGTTINNSVGIYFDFNAPIITNTTLHTIADDLVTVSTDNGPAAATGVDLQVFPNPFADQARFVLEGLDANVHPRISVYNTAGRLVRQETHNQATFVFRRGDLSTGLYFYRIEDQNGNVLAGGKMMVK